MLASSPLDVDLPDIRHLTDMEIFMLVSKRVVISLLASSKNNSHAPAAYRAAGQRPRNPASGRRGGPENWWFPDGSW